MMARIAAVFVALGLVGGAAYAQAPLVPQSKAEISLSFAPVVKAAAPSVVSIYATKVVERQLSPFAGDPMFERLFRDLGQMRPEVQNSLGSGVIVSASGLVVSNFHVVEGAQEITVVLQDRRELKADVVLADQDNDLAVLRIEEATGLTPVPFRDSDELEVGELVLAIGNPFGLDQTVSMGILSALSRSSISVGDGRGYFLQTDAAINPGNSGGALVDAAGRLVGINTAIMSRSGGSNGVGFAIPSNLVRAVVSQAEHGDKAFRRPWAGVTGQAVDGTLSEGLGLRLPEGVILSELHSDSPFATAGLKAGDIVLRFDGKPVNSPQELIYRMSARGIGAEVVVSYLRAGEPMEAKVALIAAPEAPARDTQVLGPDAGIFEGLELMRLNPAVQDELKITTAPADTVVVGGVVGWAARTGLRRGDLLVAVNGQRVSSPAEALQIMARGGRNWALDLIRDGEPLRLRFRT